MDQLRQSGLLDAASEFHVGINGGLESLIVASALFPPKAKVELHGLQCHNECRTIRMLEKWTPGHEGWYVLYFHAKNSSHDADTGIGVNWRRCMMEHCITNWRTCVADLDKGYEAVGCHWMEPPETPLGQFIFAGTFFWARASFLLTLPSIMDRGRIKSSGIDALESRYEAEVWIGNGLRVPRIMDYHHGWKPNIMLH
jgi:hypothetical protein